MNVPLGLSQTFNVKGNNQTTQGIPMALGTSQTFNVSGINQFNQGMPVALRTDQMFNVQGINQPNEGTPALQVACGDASSVPEHTLAEQEDWSWDNLPDILYQLHPVGSKSKAKIGKKTYPINGKYLKDIPVLPDQIPTDVEEFRVEAWVRLDRRIRLEDILDRMPKGHTVKPNALQQRGVRFRQAFSLCAWDSGNKKSIALGKEIEEKLEAAGICLALNTTRGLTPGLINPVLGEAGGRIPLPTLYQGKKLAKKISKHSQKNKSDVHKTEIPVSTSANKQAPELVVEERAWIEPLCHPYDTELDIKDEFQWAQTDEFFASFGMPLFEEEKIALRARWAPLSEGTELTADAQVSSIVDIEDWTWGFDSFDYESKFDFESKTQPTESLFDKIMQEYHDREPWRLSTLYREMGDGEFDI